MRRLSSIVLLLLFSLPLISPLLASSAIGTDAHLPACCRRHGAHHCAMQSPLPTTNTPALSEIPQRCPAFPAAVAQAPHGDWSLQAASLIFAELVSHPSLHLQTEARARIALDRSRHKRGPPTQLL